MNKLQRLAWITCLGLGLTVGCTEDEPDLGTTSPRTTPSAAAVPVGGEVVNAGTPEEIPGSVVAARYWIEGNPKTGEVNVFEIHPGNVIYRGEGVSLTQQELRYNFSGTATRDTSCTPGATCVPPASSIRLTTAANTVTFVDAMGNCISNGAPCGTAGNHAPFPGGTLATCAELNTFCFNAQAVSKFAQPLPNFVLRFANPGATPGNCGPSPNSPITGCQPNSTTGANGLCRFSSPVPMEIADSAESNLTSCIPGNGTSTYPCNYCMGNSGRITNPMLTGLRYALVPNQDNTTADVTLKDINTIVAAFKLTGSATFNVASELRYSTPGIVATSQQIELVDFDEDNNCALPGVSTIFVQGGGFGPPSACHGAQPLASCPLSEVHDPPGAAPAAGYSISLGGMAIPADHYVRWSDRVVGALVPATASGAGLRAAITTPLGGALTTETFDVCGGAPNSWATLTGGTITAIQPAAGVLGGNIVVAGGRTDAADTSTGIATTSFFPVPTTATISVAATAPALPVALWGAAYTVAGGRLWVIGGSSTGASCRTQAYSLGAVTDMSWRTETSLPSVVTPGGGSRCNGTAVTLGNFVVVSGGNTTPEGTTVRAGSCRFDATAFPIVWTCTNAGDDVPTTSRYGASASSDGSLALIVGGGTGGAPIAAVDEVTQAGGDPSFVGGDAILAARQLPGAAYTSAFTYVFGGQTAAGLTAAGTSTLYRSSHAGAQVWSEMMATGPVQARTGHAVVAATCGGCMAPQLFAIGGHSSGTATPDVQVYTQP